MSGRINEVVGRYLQAEDDLGEASRRMQAALYYAGGGESSDDSFSNYSPHAASANRVTRAGIMQGDFRMAGQRALAEADFLLARETELAAGQAQRGGGMAAPAYRGEFDRHGSGGFDVHTGSSHAPPQVRVEDWAVQIDSAARSRMAQAYERRVVEIASPPRAMANHSGSYARDDTPQAPWQGPGPTVSNPVALHAAGLDKAQQ
eukprot:COSAG05_NODE_6318_length_981_cov_2.003401_1_plen_203_part_10